MKKRLLYTFLAVLLACAEKNEAEQSKLQSADTQEQTAQAGNVDKFSENIGSIYGHQLRSLIDNLLVNSFVEGFTDAGMRKEPVYSQEHISAEWNKFREHLQTNRNAQGEAPLYTITENRETFSYVMGYIQGRQMTDFEDELNVALFTESFVASYAEGVTNFPELEAQVQAYVDTKQQQQNEQRSAEVQANLQKGKDFLAKNKEQEGVVTTDSGLQYKVLSLGDGDKPKPTDQVEVHYEGKLLDDTVFDSSYTRNQTASFPLNGVIAGWTEGLQYMPVGSKFRFFIPSDLAYGEQGSGRDIGPNEVLIFDVELIAIK